MRLSKLRDQMDEINKKLVSLLGRRLQIAKEIAQIKKQERLPILDSEREGSIKEEIRLLAKEHHLSPTIVEEIFQLILDYTKLEMELA